MKKLLSASIIALSLSACTASDIHTDKDISSQNKRPKNIIMVVGDGMGPAYTTAYRYYNDDPNTEIIEETVFDRTLVGMTSTYPDHVSGYVTDSAAAATALATGVKSYNGAIGVDVDKQPVETVLEWAKEQGKKTGIVVTAQVNHATPAAYMAHNESRKNYNAIADSYIDDGIKADVILGGGWQYFIRDDRNLVNEFKQAGFHYLDDMQDLTNTTPTQTPLLGLFADRGLPWALDDSNPYRLSTMTDAAIKQLDSSEQGYFLLVEGSQIDWAGHSNDIASAMREMDDLAKTLLLLENYVKNNPDTLVIITADHSTGGLTVGANGKYEWNPTVLHTMTQSPAAISKILSNKAINMALVNDLLNFSVTPEEVTLLKQAKEQSIKENATYAKLSDVQKEDALRPDSLKESISIVIKKMIDERTNTGWTSGGHTAIDVPVFAFGHSSHLFNGNLDNTDIAKNIFTLLGK